MYYCLHLGCNKAMHGYNSKSQAHCITVSYGTDYTTIMHGYNSKRQGYSIHSVLWLNNGKHTRQHLFTLLCLPTMHYGCTWVRKTVECRIHSEWRVVSTLREVWLNIDQNSRRTTGCSMDFPIIYYGSTWANIIISLFIHLLVDIMCILYYGLSCAKLPWKIHFLAWLCYTGETNSLKQMRHSANFLIQIPFRFAKTAFIPFTEIFGYYFI